MQIFIRNDRDHPQGSRYRSAEWDDYTPPIYGNIFIKSYPGKSAEAVMDAQLILGYDDFTVEAHYLSDMGRAFSSSINYMSMILGAFAFVAIVISSLGILSIMLVNVVERTREIGLRKALGASKVSIILQVLPDL